MDGTKGEFEMRILIFAMVSLLLVSFAQSSFGYCSWDDNDCQLREAEHKRDADIREADMRAEMERQQYQRDQERRWQEEKRQSIENKCKDKPWGCG